MSAPHETPLTAVILGSDLRCLSDGSRIVAILRSEDAVVWERFFVAARGMIDALLALGRVEWVGANREWHLGVCFQQLHEHGADCLPVCRDARAALNNAGVPLP